MPEFDLFLKTDARDELAHALATIVASEVVVAAGRIGSASWLAQEYRIANSPLVYCVNFLFHDPAPGQFATVISTSRRDSSL